MPAILVVDDDRAVQEMLADCLTEAGYRVATCRDGREVIAQLERQPFDLLILDVLIPHMNGFTLIEKVREHPELGDLPVIMISGIYRSRNHRNDMMTRHGVIDYLDKPIKTDKLLELVAAVAGDGEPALDSEKPITLDKPKIAPVTLTNVKSSPNDEEDSATIPMLDSQSEGVRLVDPVARIESKEIDREQRQRFKTSAFVQHGSIKRNPVAAVLGKIWHERRTGALLLKRNKVKKIIYVREGHAYFVKSNLVSECLGKLLVRERLITEEECAESIRKMKETGKRQGELLVEMRSMTENNLVFALELQLETKIFEPFGWESGEFRFTSSTTMPDAITGLEWEGGALIVEGIRRAFDETRLRGLMLPILDVPFHWTDTSQGTSVISDLGFTKAEREAVTGAKLPNNTRELLNSTSLDPPDTLRVIYSLIALELLVPKG